MKILVVVGHPAHVHLFRNSIASWIESGFSVIVAARDRELVTDLLDSYQIEYEIVSKVRPGTIGKLYELFEQFFKLFLLSLRHRPNVYVGTSWFIGPISALLGGISAVFNEDDVDLVKLISWIGYPLATKVVVPECVRDKRTKQYIEYKSYHELAYLHPNHFTPNPTVLDELGVGPNEKFFIIRLVALKAFHDVGHCGLSDEVKKELLRKLAEHGKVFINVEGEMPDYLQEYQFHIPAYWMHDALSFATLLVSDSQTMTAEAAVLGTPSLRCNSWVGRISYLEELEDEYGLTYGFYPEQADEMLDKLDELLAYPDLATEWGHRRNRMLGDQVDFAKWTTDFVVEHSGVLNLAQINSGSDVSDFSE